MSKGDLFKKGREYSNANQLECARKFLRKGLEKNNNKPHKEFSPLLKEVETKLVDARAEEGEQALKDLNLDACRKKIAVAKEYGTITPRLTSLEDALNQFTTGLKQQFDNALQQSTSGNHQEALTQLKTFTRFEKELPTIHTEIVRITNLYANEMLSKGDEMIQAHRWDDAFNSFRKVLSLRKVDEKANIGLKSVERGRSADQLASDAKSSLSHGNYQMAFKNINAAIARYPEAREYGDTRNQILKDWIQYLLKDVPALVASSKSFNDSRDACLRLEQVQELEPGNPEVEKYLKGVSSEFGANAFERALQLEDNLERVATALVVKLVAQKRTESGTVKPEDLKKAARYFNGKRASQILLLVENESSASAGTFASLAQTKAKNAIDNLALPDLKIIMQESQMGADDGLYSELRPDGKSATAQLKISISRYESERNITSTRDVPSKWLAGEIKQPNEKKIALEQELMKMLASLNKRKQGDRSKDKPTNEGYTEAKYDLLKAKYDHMEDTITGKDEREYNYQELKYSQRTIIELNITLQDFRNRELIRQDKIEFRREPEATEISGVREGKDINGLVNQPARLPDREQVLREGERTVIEQLGQKIQELVPAYTDRFFREGEQRLKQNRFEDALEFFLCHWAFVKGRLDESQRDLVYDVVKRGTGFDMEKDGRMLLSAIQDASAR